MKFPRSVDIAVKPVALTPDESPLQGSAERSLALCALVAEEGRPITLAEMSAKLALPKGTVHRLCATLLATVYLARDIDERMFTVGPALRRLAFNSLNHATLRGLRHEVLSELVSQIGETCNFTTLDGTEVLYLDRVEARRPLRLTIDIGEHVPLHCTSSGKLLLAHMPKRRRDDLIRRMDLPRLTPATLTTGEELRAECDDILKRGYSKDREEFVPGLISVAVPVKDPQGTVRATLSVHAPVARMPMEIAEKQLDRLKAAARRMSTLI